MWFQSGVTYKKDLSTGRKEVIAVVCEAVSSSKAGTVCLAHFWTLQTRHLRHSGHSIIIWVINEWMSQKEVTWALTEVGIVEIKRYILGKYYRDRDKDICWLMKCGKDGPESIRTVKVINTKWNALQVSVKIKYNCVHENALWGKKTTFLWNQSYSSLAHLLLYTT